ncbi:MAG: DNA repair protein RadC [Burkholderiales bacterium]
MSISTWPQDQRPREKLLKQGAASLSDAELLAIFLRTGVRGKNAVQLGQDLLNAFDGVAGLFASAPEALSEVKGLGPAKLVQLLAVKELAARVLSGELRQRDSLTSPQAVKDYLRLKLMHLGREVFVVVFLDAQHRVITSEELFAGTLTQTSVYPREIVKRCLALNAAAVIFAHNHPSGVAEPSRADELLTATLKRTLELVDVRVLDHFVVGGSGILSFAERGLL